MEPIVKMEQKTIEGVQWTKYYHSVTDAKRHAEFEEQHPLEWLDFDEHTASALSPEKDCAYHITPVSITIIDDDGFPE